MIDIKTIYEQITASFIKIAEDETDEYTIEIFQQPDTPIYAVAYWTNIPSIIRSVTFTSNLDSISFTN